MAKARRAATSPEQKAAVPSSTPSPPEAKPGERPLWVPILSAASVVAILASSYFLLKIHAPFLAELPLGGSPGKTFVGFGAVFVVVFGLIQAILRSEPLAPVREAMAKAVSLVFERRQALVLAPVALVLSLGTWWHWQSSARTPILRIEPAGDFLYYLADGDQAAKPPWRTVEIRVQVREGAGEQRFYPQDGRAIDIGASESVLRWRAARESEEPESLGFLATPRLRADDVVAIRVLCRRSGAELFRARSPVSGEPFPLNDGEFDKRMETCDPI